MAGGTWDAQNKLQPGVYINFKSSPKALLAAGERGIVAIARDLSWGEPGAITRVGSPQEALGKLGYDIFSGRMRFLREIFMGTASTPGASGALVYRLPQPGAKAAAVTAGGLTATARFPGARGNDIAIAVTPDPDTETQEQGKYAVFTVETLVDGLVADSQRAGSFASAPDCAPGTAGDLEDNAWVRFSGGALEPAAGAPLSGGLDWKDAPAAPAAGHAAFLQALEAEPFNVVAYDGDDAAVKQGYANFVKRRIAEHGLYSQAVMPDCAQLDSEAAISVGNGLALAGGETLDAAEACWWVAGATAGAANYQSLTYAAHPGAEDVRGALSPQQLDDAVRRGELVFFKEYGEAKVLSDINTLTTLTPEKSRAFCKNRTIRVLQSIANDLRKTYSLHYVSKVDNNELGRSRFKVAAIEYIMSLQANNAVQNFSPDDIEVLPGAEADAVAVSLAIQPVDSIEKIYMTVTVS
jgi:hypothetical protein